MAHHRMGLCEAPNTSGESQFLCQYCRTKAKDINYPRRIEGVPEFQNEPRNGALFPKIKMERRVPDLLHMVKNVTKYLLEKIGLELHRGNKSKEKKWSMELMNPYLNKARKIANSSTPQSLDTAYWEFMKKDDGGIVDIIKISKQNMNKKRRNEIEADKWSQITNILISWKIIFNLIKNPNVIDINTLKYNLGTFKNNIILMNWKCTPWVHILMYHYFNFENSGNVRPILLTCHAIEGHHRQVKRDFHHSLHSTKRRNKNSGLFDILTYDNIIINLISRRYYPWEKLKMKIGNKIFEKKKVFLKNILKKYIQ